MGLDMHESSISKWEIQIYNETWWLASIICCNAIGMPKENMDEMTNTADLVRHACEASYKTRWGCNDKKGLENIILETKITMYHGQPKGLSSV